MEGGEKEEKKEEKGIESLVMRKEKRKGEKEKQRKTRFLPGALSSFAAQSNVPSSWLILDWLWGQALSAPFHLAIVMAVCEWVVNESKKRSIASCNPMISPLENLLVKAAMQK